LNLLIEEIGIHLSCQVAPLLIMIWFVNISYVFSSSSVDVLFGLTSYMWVDQRHNNTKDFNLPSPKDEFFLTNFSRLIFHEQNEHNETFEPRQKWQKTLNLLT
jgi:hypothetical protein